MASCALLSHSLIAIRLSETRSDGYTSWESRLRRDFRRFGPCAPRRLASRRVVAASVARLGGNRSEPLTGSHGEVGSPCVCVQVRIMERVGYTCQPRSLSSLEAFEVLGCYEAARVGEELVSLQASD